MATDDTYADSSSDLIASDRVEGTAVYDSAGEKLGSIDHVMIDKRSGQARYAVLEFGGFLGMNTDRYPLPWSALKYDTEREGYVVPMDRAQLESAPSYSDDDDRPSYDRPYDERLYGFYGTIVP